MAETRTKGDLPNFMPIVRSSGYVKSSCSPYNFAEATEHGGGDEPPETVAYRLREVDSASDTIEDNEEDTDRPRGCVPIW